MTGSLPPARRSENPIRECPADGAVLPNYCDYPRTPTVLPSPKYLSAMVLKVPSA